jgi:hypothetical protein
MYWIISRDFVVGKKAQKFTTTTAPYLDIYAEVSPLGQSNDLRNYVNHGKTFPDIGLCPDMASLQRISRYHHQKDAETRLKES